MISKENLIVYFQRLNIEFLDSISSPFQFLMPLIFRVPEKDTMAELNMICHWNNLFIFIFFSKTRKNIEFAHFIQRKTF